MRQQSVLLEQQQVMSVDASERLRMLAEQNHQSRALVEAIGGHMRERQRAQENTLRMFHDEYHR
eukprot:4904035-Prorocentrum_lima.AAC.1